MSENKNFPTECVTIVRVTCDEAEPVVLREGVAQLFKLYFDELYNMGCDLGFQGFQSEWEDLPGKYDFKKKGGLFVAVNGPEIKSADQVVGCIALRPLEGNCGEVKRMFIRATSRRNGVGNLLAKAVISHAWEEGYSEIKLDSLERLDGAVKLYERLGFTRIAPYCECPEEDHVCMNLLK